MPMLAKIAALLEASTPSFNAFFNISLGTRFGLAALSTNGSDMIRLGVSGNDEPNRPTSRHRGGQKFVRHDSMRRRGANHATDFEKKLASVNRLMKPGPA